MMRTSMLLLLLFIANAAHAAELVRGVRSKISAGDLPSAVAAVEDYRLANGADAEYLDAVGWLARGAELLRRPDLAAGFVAELRREIPVETAQGEIPFGAAIEVESRLIAARDGRGAAIRFLEGELKRARATALRSRIAKNINLLSLEGQQAPAIDVSTHLSAAPLTLETMRGKPVLLYFFAEWCGDCKAQAASLTRIRDRYKAKGLELMAVTRLYGGPASKPMSPQEEHTKLAKVWSETYPELADVPVVISTEAMVRYGASATPTFVLVDPSGVVRLYTPTRLSEAELARRIDELLIP